MSLSPTRRDLLFLALLVLAAVGLRAYQLAYTELTTRDGIGYTRQAHRLESEPWPDVIRSSPQHPGYAVAIVALRSLTGPIVRDNSPRSWQLSAQLVSCLASVLLVFPVFYLGRHLFDARVGFASSLLVQVLPSTGRMMPDALSEPLFLLLAISSLCLCVIGVDRRSPPLLAAAGLFGGVAYLVRTEALLVVGVAGLVLLAAQVTRHRRAWSRTVLDGAALAVPCAVVAVPFMLLIGGVSLKAAAGHMLDAQGWVQPPRDAGMIRAALPPAIWWIGPEITPADRYGWAARAVVVVLDKAFSHWLWLPMLAGLWLFRRKIADHPGSWVPVGVAMILLPLCYRLAQSAGYVGERHLMLFIVPGLIWACAALVAMSDRLGTYHPRLSPTTCALALASLVVAVCLPRTLAPLHGNRKGLRQVGEWLAKNAKPTDQLLDPLAWSGFYAGRTLEPAEPTFPGHCYVVLERSDSEHAHLWYLVDHAKQMARWGEIAHVEKVKRGKKVAEVVVYRVNVDGRGRPIPDGKRPPHEL